MFIINRINAKKQQHWCVLTSKLKFKEKDLIQWLQQTRNPTPYRTGHRKRTPLVDYNVLYPTQDSTQIKQFNHHSNWSNIIRKRRIVLRFLQCCACHSQGRSSRACPSGSCSAPSTCKSPPCCPRAPPTKTNQTKELRTVAVPRLIRKRHKYRDDTAQTYESREYRVYTPSLGIGLDSVEVRFPTGSQDVLQKQGAEASQSKNSSRW